jgi:hypothetical protein
MEAEMIVRHFDKLGFTAKAYPESYYVKFELFEIAGTIQDGPMTGTRIYAPMNDYPTLGNAPVYAHGSVKWDGCSDWYFDEQNRCCLHGCSRENLTNLGDALAACWDWAGELIESWDGE